MKVYQSILSLTFLIAAAMADNHVLGQDCRSACILTDSVKIVFPQSKSDLHLSLGDNGAALEAMDRRLTTVMNDSVYRLQRVNVYGGASPEGSVEFNKQLSERRAATLFEWFGKYGRLSETEKFFTFSGRDWENVLRYAEQDMSIPYRDETIALLSTIVEEKRQLKGGEPEGSLDRVRQLRGGEPYRYLYRNIFPKVRASKVVIEYERIPKPPTQTAKKMNQKRDTLYIERIVELRDTVYIDNCDKATRRKAKTR